MMSHFGTLLSYTLSLADIIPAGLHMGLRLRSSVCQRRSPLVRLHHPQFSSRCLHLHCLCLQEDRPDPLVWQILVLRWYDGRSHVLNRIIKDVDED